MIASQALERLEIETWHCLQRVLSDPDDALHYLTLCNLDRATHPQARILVLRAVEVAERHMVFHTDCRSPKWDQLQHDPRVSLLGYDPHACLQLRFRGRVTLHPPGSALNVAAWVGLSNWTRTTYCGGPPGALLAMPENPTPDQEPNSEDTEVGRQAFGPLVYKPRSLDWFQHRRGNLKRAFFRYGEGSATVSADWIAP